MVVADPVPKEKAKVKKDEELILGRWKMVELDMGADGKKAVPEEWKVIEYVFAEGGKMTMLQGKRDPVEGTFKLDPAVKPKTLDVTLADNKVQILGLYELDGDTLKLCITQKPGADRPTEVKGDAKGFTAVWVMERVKDEKKDK